jgi:hypothetical protein
MFLSHESSRDSLQNSCPELDLLVELALSSDARLRAQQLTFLEAQLGSTRALRCTRLRGELDHLDASLRIPLLELAMPALKQRPAEQLDFLMELVKRVLALDSEQRLFDYVLLRMLTAYLAELPGPTLGARPDAARGRAQRSPRAAAAAVLAAVAGHGHSSADAAQSAFLAGLDALGGRANQPAELAFAAFEPRDLARLDDALLRLKTLRPRDKHALLRAVLATIRHDRRVDVAEIELFRAIAATLGCPVPPSAAAARFGASADTHVRLPAASAGAIGLPTGDA